MHSKSSLPKRNRQMFECQMPNVNFMNGFRLVTDSIDRMQCVYDQGMQNHRYTPRPYINGAYKSLTKI